MICPKCHGNGFTTASGTVEPCGECGGSGTAYCCEGTNYRVMPTNDLKEHIDSKDCWCNPVQDEKSPNLLIHHAADGREKH